MTTGNGVTCALLGLAALAGCDRIGQLPTAFSMLPPSGFEVRAPANLPPESFAGEFWVDKRGCEYIRTARGDWAPRFGNNGKAFCNADLQGVTGDPRASAAPLQTGPKPGEVLSVDPNTGAVLRVAAPQIIPPSYVNVATFTRTANGIAARKAFAELGFPIVGAGTAPPAGRAVTVVLGPFTEKDALDDALNVARSLGYENATTYSN